MKDRILVLAAHTDDAEIGCGGLIARSVDFKKEVFVVCFSPCVESIPECFPLDATEKEFDRSMEYFGVTGSTLLNHSVRLFPEHRQEILDDMISIGRQFNPDLILTHSRHDPHQDHRVIVENAIAAFRQCSLLSWETPRMSYLSISNHFVSLSVNHLEAKINAINCYDSQKIKPNFLLTYNEAIRSLAQTRGAACNCKYAEAYEAIKWIW